MGRGILAIGYSVECALKACIVQQFRHHEVPDKRLVNSFYTHKLDELMLISGLKPAFDARPSVSSGRIGTSFSSGMSRRATILGQVRRRRGSLSSQWPVPPQEY